MYTCVRIRKSSFMMHCFVLSSVCKKKKSKKKKKKKEEEKKDSDITKYTGPVLTDHPKNCGNFLWFNILL